MHADRFTQKTVGLTIGGHMIPVERYTYEGVFHVWDVYRVSEGFKYATDCREVETPGPHHMAIMEHFGLVSQEVDHRCGMKSCVNPAHLQIKRGDYT